MPVPHRPLRRPLAAALGCALSWLTLALPGRALGASPDAITLAITGDVALYAHYVDHRLRTVPFDRNPFRHLAPALRSVDLAVTTFDGVLVSRDPRYAVPSLNLWLPPVFATVFRPAGIRLVNLAANHIMDGRDRGVLETLGHLRREGLQTLGAGRTDAEARQPYVLRRGAACVGVLPATTLLNHRPRREAPVAYYPEPRHAERLAAVRQLARSCAYVVVLLHFGQEGVHYPEKHKQRLARQVIEAGASLIAGGHPHALQGVEYYRHGVIVYSLGNFVFPNARFMHRRTGLLTLELGVEARPRLRRLELIPALIERNTWAPRPLTVPREQEEDLGRMRAYCRPFGTRVSLVNGRLRFEPPASGPGR
jgi:poly-gamma-glutamate synthesis protein (capsule biosynthesis protein)